MKVRYAERDDVALRCFRCMAMATHRLAAKGASAVFSCANAACVRGAERQLRTCINNRVYVDTFCAVGFTKWGRVKRR